MKRRLGETHTGQNITNLPQSSRRLIVSVTAVKGFRLFIHDVNQAYLQSEEDLVRQLFFLTKNRNLDYFQRDEKDILHLLGSMYGTTDAGYWGVTTDRQTCEELQLEPLRIYPLIYIKSNDKGVHAVIVFRVTNTKSVAVTIFDSLIHRKWNRLC